jgi:hypothetical protein
LLPHLQERGLEYAKEATEKLSKRGEDESRQMRTLLESQRKHILEKKLEDSQRVFKFGDEELRQLNADRRHWNNRLDKLETELKDEPDRIKDIYRIRSAPRIEPVGIVYLWPASEGGH